MDNKKKLIITVVIFLVVLVFSVLVFTGVFNKKAPGEDEITTDENATQSFEDKLQAYATVDYKTHISSQKTVDLPYLQTDIENVFYTMSADGEVTFYTLGDGQFTIVEETGTYDVSVTMSEQKLTATVSYIEQDGVISGYGFYKPSTDKFDLYPYAFFRIANFGAENEKVSSSSYILLVDTTKEDFYSNEKIYDEAFIFKPSDSSCTRMLSEANRTVGHDGTKRNDYTLLNNNVIVNSTTHHLF